LAKALTNKFAIVGLGLLAGRYPQYSQRALQAEAARLAIEDAGLNPSQVNGAVVMMLAPGSGTVPVESDGFPRILGLPCRMFFQIGRGGTAGIMGIMASTKFLEVGMADYVVLSYGAKDWSRSRGPEKTGIRSIEKIGHWGKPFGDLAAVSHHTFFASRHMHEYGTPPEAFGEIAVAQRAWAQKNPGALFNGKPLSLDDYMNSPTVVDPYRLLDMCMINDGAMAFVLTTAERARDCAKPAVMVLGAGTGEAMGQLWWDKANYTQLAVKTAKEVAFREADITIEDVDFAGLYDCFTAEVLFQIEDYGWCKKGEGAAFVANGGIGPGGRVPINTSGGLLSGYYLGELTHIAEAITQLRGEAGERQIADARVGIASGHGGEILSPGMCSTHGTLVLGRP
jgi:acetyl-CoA acetyltransferase